MKIVMIAPFSVYPKGTVPIRMLPIAENLVKRGNFVEIVVPPYDNPSESGRQYCINGVKISNVNFINLPIIKYFATLSGLLRRIFSVRPNLVYIFKPKGYSGLAAASLAMLRRLGLLKNTAIILDTDDWEGRGGFADYFKKQSIYPQIMLNFFDFQEQWIPRHMDAITVASRALESKLLSEGIAPNKIFYVPNGKPDRNFDVPEQEVKALKTSLGLTNVPVILLYTRFFEFKLEKVVDVLKCIKQSIPDVKLLVVGKGEFGEEKELVRLASNQGLGNSVVFSGWINSIDIPKYLALGDIAIYPFDDTPLNRAKCPGKLIELMNARRAIVADDVGQIREYIQNGKSGLLADYKNTAQFAALVIKVLNDDNLKKTLATNSGKRINEAFNWCMLTNIVELALSQARRVK